MLTTFSKFWIRCGTIEMRGQLQNLLGPTGLGFPVPSSVQRRVPNYFHLVSIFPLKVGCIEFGTQKNRSEGVAPNSARKIISPVGPSKILQLTLHFACAAANSTFEEHLSHPFSFDTGGISRLLLYNVQYVTGSPRYANSLDA